MKYPVPIHIPTEQGLQCCLVGYGSIKNPLFLAGRMTRPDTLSWHACGPGPDGYRVHLMGLYRGRPRYGSCTTTVRALLKAFIDGGLVKEANLLMDSARAWGVALAPVESVAVELATIIEPDELKD